MTRRGSTIAVLCLLSIGSAWALGGGDDGKNTKREEISFRSVNTKTGPKIQVNVGDMVFLTSHLTFLHDGKPDSNIRVVKDRVELRTEKSTLLAKMFTMPLRSGFLQKRSHDSN